MNAELFTDGGVCGRNPSKVGGTWTWVLVEEDVLVRQASGIVTPEDLGVAAVTNNQTELLAAVRALDAVGKEWRGVLWTDSEVSWFRLQESKRFNGVPAWLRLWTLELRRQPRQYQVKLLGGHPTKKDLERGHRRDGTPVSSWNVLCDKRCQQLAKSIK